MVLERVCSRAMGRAGTAVVCTAVAGALALASPRPQAPASAAVPIESPAAIGSQAYALGAGADGQVYLVWIEPAGEGVHALKFSRLDRGEWTPARAIARGSDWFVNWADHPSITARLDGSLLVHWLVNTGRKQGSYGYGIRVVRSANGGATWSTIFEDGMRNVADYAGFLTFAPGSHDTEAIYLAPLVPDDGTAHQGHTESEPVKTLAAVSFGPDGTVRQQKVVDADVCSCCPTDIAITTSGPVVVYRDHLPGNIRDISIVRRVNGIWTEPARVARDGWQIPGCPTNGPALAARNARLAVAWFTAAGNTPRLQLAFSNDAGATFGPPSVVDDGNPVGWPDLVMLEDGTALVSWLERRGNGRGEVLVRRVAEGRRPGPPFHVAESASGRATGIPHMVLSGDRLIVAWRTDRVLTASVPITAVQP
jgi:hypothetical protein